VEVSAAIEELRALAHGLCAPPSCTQVSGPARAGQPVAGTGRRVPSSDRFPSDVETAAYFVACEGLTNAVKHARAGEVRVDVAHQDSTLVVRIAVDGVGGAAIGHGSQLTGLADRVAARGGRLMVDCVRGRGTTLSAELPCVP
jgi:signal transduction histidine kinase